jgi:hypothetical protein
MEGNQQSRQVQAALQSTLFWGCFATVATIVLAVVAAMIHDIRWVLLFAWPFAAFAAWEFARVCSARKGLIRLATSISTLVSGVLLGWLYFALTPAEQPSPQAMNSPVVAPAQGAAPKATAPPKGRYSTWSRAVYICKNKGAPDQKTLDKNSAEFKKYVTALADTSGYAVQFPKAIGGDKAELTAATPLGLKRMSETHVTKIILEIRRIGKNLIGIYTMDFDDTFLGKLISGQSVVPDSSDEIRIRGRVEDLAGVNKGDCELQ